MIKEIRRETREIIPRYYGLSFFGQGNTRIFTNPSTAAMAFVAITSPDKEDGLTDMLRDWQKRKPKELARHFGYEPLFKLSQRQAKKLLECKLEKLIEIVREKIRENHGSYNLWDCSGKEAVWPLQLMGDTLVADVRSQETGKYGVNLKGAVRGRNGEIRYADTFCGCEDNRWDQAKGGHSITIRRKCIHVDMAELDSFLQDTTLQHHARQLMKEKETHKGQRSLVYNFISNSDLKYLVADVLIAREVLGESAYDIDRKLLSPLIGPAIVPVLSLQRELGNERAIFDIIKQKMRTREIDPDLLKAQEIIDEAFGRELIRKGYRWQGYCLELGREATRYENPETGDAVSLVLNAELPFYVVRNFEKARILPVFTRDHAPQDPFEIALLPHWRIDDRTRKETRCYVEPAVRINVPHVKQASLRYDLPQRVINAYRKAIMERKDRSSVAPTKMMKALRIYY